MGWSRVAYFAVFTALIYCQLTTDTDLPVCTLATQTGLIGICENIATKSGVCNGDGGTCRSTDVGPISQQTLATLEGCSSECQRLSFAYVCEYTCLKSRSSVPACSSSITQLFNACKTCGTGAENIVQNAATPAAFATALDVAISQDTNVCTNFAANARNVETSVPSVTEVTITSNPETHQTDPRIIDPSNDAAATTQCTANNENVRFVTVLAEVKVQSVEAPTEVIFECIPPGTIIPAATRTHPASQFRPTNPATTPRTWESVGPLEACVIGVPVNFGTWRVNVIARNTFGTSSSATNTNLDASSTFQVDVDVGLYKPDPTTPTPFEPTTLAGAVAACPTADTWSDVLAGLHGTQCNEIAFVTTYVVGGQGTGLEIFECCLDTPCTLTGVATVTNNPFVIANIRNGDIDADVTVRSINNQYIVDSISPINGVLRLQSFQPLEIHTFATNDIKDPNNRVPDADEDTHIVEVLSLDGTTQITQQNTQPNAPACRTDIDIPTDLRTKWRIISTPGLATHCILDITSRLTVHDNTKPVNGGAETKTTDHFNLQLENCAELALSSATAILIIDGKNNAVADVVLRGSTALTNPATEIDLCGDATTVIADADLGKVYIRGGYLKVLNGYILRFDVKIAGMAPLARKATTSAVLVPEQRTAVEECWCSVCGRDVTVSSGGALLLGRPTDEPTNACRSLPGFNAVDATLNLTPVTAYQVRSLFVEPAGVVVFKGVRVNGPILYVGFGPLDAEIITDNVQLGGNAGGNTVDPDASVRQNGRAIFQAGSIVEVELDLASIPSTAHEIILMRYARGLTAGVCNIQASLRIANQAQLGSGRVPELKCIVNEAFATQINGDDGPFTLILSVPASPPPSPPSGPGAGAGSRLSTNQFVLFLDQSAVEFPQSAFLASIEQCLQIDDQNIKIEAYNLVDGDVHITFRCVDNTPGTANELCQRIINEALNENSCLGQATKAFNVDENSDFDRDSGSNEALFGLFALLLIPVCCCLLCVLFLKNRRRQADNQYMQDTATFSNVAAAPQPINQIEAYDAITYPAPYDAKGPIYV